MYFIALKWLDNLTLAKKNISLIFRSSAANGFTQRESVNLFGLTDMNLDVKKVKGIFQ